MVDEARGPWGDARQWVGRSRGGDPTDVPGSVRTAVQLMYFGAVLACIDTLGDLVFSSEDENDRFVLGSIVGTAIAVAVWLWMASANGQGKPWARVVGTIFGVVAIIGGVLALVTLPLAAGEDWWTLLMSLTSGILATAILVLLYRDESNRWYSGYGGRGW